MSCREKGRVRRSQLYRKEKTKPIAEKSPFLGLEVRLERRQQRLGLIQQQQQPSGLSQSCRGNLIIGRLHFLAENFVRRNSIGKKSRERGRGLE